jgi:hypothetical protein
LFTTRAAWAFTWILLCSALSSTPERFSSCDSSTILQRIGDKLVPVLPLGKGLSHESVPASQSSPIGPLRCNLRMCRAPACGRQVLVRVNYLRGMSHRFAGGRNCHREIAVIRASSGRRRRRFGHGASRFPVGSRVRLRGCIRRMARALTAAPAKKISATIPPSPGYAGRGYAEYVVAPERFVYPVQKHSRTIKLRPAAGNHRISVSSALRHSCRRLAGFLRLRRRRTCSHQVAPLECEVYVATRAPGISRHA